MNNFSVRQSPGSPSQLRIRTFLFLGLVGACSVAGESDPAHVNSSSEKPAPWPNGVIPYELSSLSPAQQVIALAGMKRWIDTGAKITFVPRTAEKEYVHFTGQTNAGIIKVK